MVTTETKTSKNLNCYIFVPLEILIQVILGWWGQYFQLWPRDADKLNNILIHFETRAKRVSPTNL